MTRLVLGPLLRHVDRTRASVWVETDGPATVTVRLRADDGDRDGRSVAARTFAVHGHHYALLDVDGLEPGSRHAYAVELDGEGVWPPAAHDDLGLPPPTLSTLDPDRPLTLAYGSCRTSVSHDEKGNATHGVDALRAYATALASPGDHDGEAERPDLLLFLGDQVYADETTAAMREFISSRRDIEAEPGTELKDYEEYAHLYWLAWSDPTNRWLLSTVPSLMIFDDHDVRDDWNTSRAWKDAMEATSWWHGRIVAALASYWVYQHLGNMTPEERDADPVWREIAARTQGPPGSVDDGGGDGDDDDPAWDAGPLLDAFAERADQDPTSYRWSFARDLGPQARLVVVDSRAARVLDPEHRALLDDEELAWLDGQLRGDVDHLLVGTSLPFLLAPGLHYVEAFSEGLAGGGWGERLVGFGERVRQTVDLEHWAAFQGTFAAVARMTLEVARGERGRAPATVTFLSGDVHHSYLSQVAPLPSMRSTVLQAVCSPMRNPLSRKWRFATAALSYGVAGPLGHVLARSAKVPDAPFRWKLREGPWFDNNLATLQIHGPRLRLRWATGRVDDADAVPHDHPRLQTVSDVTVP